MRRDTDLKDAVKIHIKAETLGKLDYVTLDPVTQRPKYGARTLIINRLLENWLQSIDGTPLKERTPVPTLEEIQEL